MSDFDSNRSSVVVKRWASVAALAFLLAFLGYPFIGGLVLFSASALVFVLLARKSRPLLATAQRLSEGWSLPKKFFLDLVAVLSLFTLSVCMIPVISLAYGEIPSLSLLWTGAMLSIPAALFVRWRFFLLATNRLAFMQAACVAITVAVLISTLHFLPLSIREDDRMLNWILILIVVVTYSITSLVLRSLKERASACGVASELGTNKNQD